MTDASSTGGASRSNALLRIRQAALNKAAEDIRNQRLMLLQDFQSGRITKDEYMSQLQRLMAQSKEITGALKSVR